VRGRARWNATNPQYDVECSVGVNTNYISNRNWMEWNGMEFPRGFIYSAPIQWNGGGVQMASQITDHTHRK
jgi:hypothetical protein